MSKKNKHAKRRELVSISDLRKVLCEEIQNLRAGTTKPTVVNSLVNASRTVIATVKIEIEFAKLCGGKPNGDFVRNDRVLVEQN